MPKTKKNDSEILAEVREVIKDMRSHLRVKNSEYGGFDDLDEGMTVEIIREITDGAESALTRDYRKSKLRQAARSAPAVA